MGRAPCCDKANVKRGPWSPEEDAILKSYLDAHGTGGNWIALPKKAGLKRCGKSCRLRWLNYLRPDIKHGGFTEEEDNIILNLYTQLGSRWSLIASRLPGRTDNDVKNHWNTKLKKKVLAAGKTSPEINNCNIIASTNDNNPSSAPPCSVPLVPKTETDSLIYSDSLAQSSVTWPNAIRHHVGYRPVVDGSLNSDSRQFSFPGVMNMSEFVASSSASSIRIVSPSQDQESTSISADSSSLAVDNNGLSSVLPGNNSLEDVGTMMDSAGFGFSHDFIDGLDLFQERTGSGVASNYWYPNLADFDIYAEMQPPGLNQGVNNQQYY